MATGAFAMAQQRALDFKPMIHMDEYLEELAAQGKSDSHIRGIRNGLHHFAEFLGTEDVRHPEEITRRHCVRFQAHVEAKVSAGEWAKSTGQQNMKRVRGWINWMDRLDYIETNPWKDIRVGSIKKQPNPVSDDDMHALWAAHNAGAFNPKIDRFTFHRREIILTLLYSWGLRIHELEALTVANMDMRLDFVSAINKGGGRKTLPYTPEIKNTFRRWDSVRSQYAIHGEDSLLITKNGTRLPKEMIRTIIMELGALAGVKVNPHRLRDTCGTNMLDDDVPVERVQAVLGHTNMAQTLAYARVNDKAVYKSVEISMDPRLRMFQNTRDLPK